jgi:hypothetical protein
MDNVQRIQIVLIKIAIVVLMTKILIGTVLHVVKVILVLDKGVLDVRILVLIVMFQVLTLYGIQ